MSRCMECVAATVSVRPSQLAAVLYRARERSRGGPSLISLMVSVDVRHHAYLLTLDQEKGGGWSWVLIAGWIVLLLTEPSKRSRTGRWMELGSHSWMDCLAADRAQQRSRAGRWSWAVI